MDTLLARVRAGRRGVLAGAVLILLIGLIGVRTVSASAEADPAPPTTTPPTTAAAPAAPAPPANPALDQAVAEAQDFVAKTRGLAFKEPVKATLLSDADFAQHMTKGETIDPALLKRQEGILTAMGLMHKGESLGDGSPESTSRGVVGLYVPSTKELLVRGTEVTPYTRSILVHELTHALDDQWFNLNRPELAKTDDEAAQSFTALVEGDAVRVQRAFIDQMNAADKASVLREDTRAAAPSDGAPAPEAVGALVMYPYAMGPRFVDYLLAHGGQSRLDKAFAAPPTTSQQIFWPIAYSANIGTYPVTYPVADGPVIDRGTLGALGMVLMLSSEVGWETAGTAASTWMADRYVAWEADGRTCIRARLLLGSPWEAAYVADVASAWAHAQRDAQVEAPGTVIVTSCA